MRFVQGILTLNLVFSCLPLLYHIFNHGNKLNDIINRIDKISKEVQCKISLRQKMHQYAVIYAVIVFPLYIINVFRDGICWRIFLKGIIDVSGFDIHAGLMIQFLHFIVESEMMILVLANRELLRAINDGITVSY